MMLANAEVMYAPGERATLLGLFLPKPGGETRTVSLMPTLTRPWKP